MSRTAAISFLLPLIAILVGCPGQRQPAPNPFQNLSIPNRYVVAYVIDSPPRRVNTRFSDNGINWSAPVEVQDLGLPAAVPQGIPAGIGARPDQYLVAWFDSNVLHTVVSSDATNWSHPMSHGFFNVGAQSKPSIEWNFNTDQWTAAFRTDNSQIAIVDVSGSRGETTFVPNVTTLAAPSLVWQNNALNLIFADASLKLRFITSTDGVNWSPSGGTLLRLSAGGSDIRGGHFTVTRSGTDVVLANHIVRGPTINVADILIFKYDGGTLTREATIQRTYLDSIGPVVIGRDGTRSVIDAGALGTTIWHEGTELSSFTTPRVRAVAGAFGPSVNKPLPQFRCGPCNKCIQSGGVNATDYRRTCVTESGIPSDFHCLVCGFCENIPGFVGPHRRCRATQFGSDAPGQPDAEERVEPCGLCPP